MEVLGHKHPLKFIDLELEYPHNEDEEEEEEEEENDSLNVKGEFRCICGRVCGVNFNRDHNHNLWIYKCEKCRYFVHLDCATSRREPFMSIVSFLGPEKQVKNYQDSDHPNLIHLPFPDQSYSIPRHILEKQIGSKIFGSDKAILLKHDSHEHPLILVDNNDEITPSSTSSKIYSISCHDPMKRVELLCNGCSRPIMSPPFYKCEKQHCNFVLHEWCTRLPNEIKNHPRHNHHTLILITRSPTFLNVFDCSTCMLSSNGFSYTCIECEFMIDVNCGLLPDKITHDAHPNHLLSLVTLALGYFSCQNCTYSIYGESFSCSVCDFDLHPKCAYLFPRSIRHKIDKHPLDLSYVPIENHKSDYFCEICENVLNPQGWFYHCHTCVQSIHTECAFVIHEYEKATNDVNLDLNIKFGGTHMLGCHPHPLSFVRGIRSDGKCKECGRTLIGKMILKCGLCNYAIDYYCCLKLTHPWE
ncbi:uncharacterized protein [Rutidosis leptorrhynchoides]|uniref:uncharacterized protein n=1 Tax=Rutidosis leptorrhynchoides TaxID=125765 RepID=UPI003A98D0BE